MGFFEIFYLIPKVMNDVNCCLKLGFCLLSILVDTLEKRILATSDVVGFLFFHHNQEPSYH
ncbi:MAG: hypothetical protein ACJASL_001885 [Paraglaciecola sp.]|jgi:hypothetical protein